MLRYNLVIYNYYLFSVKDIISKENIGNRLKQLRNSHGLSQTEFAAKVDLKRGNYAQIEMGKQFPPYDALLNIAKEFKKSYEWILHGFDMEELTREVIAELSQEDNNTLKHRVSGVSMPCFTKDDKGVEQTLLVGRHDYHNYITHLADETYLESLPLFTFPFSNYSELGRRAFEIKDDQMAQALLKGDIAICRPLEKLEELIESRIYVLVTSNSINAMRYAFLSENNQTFVGSTEQKSLIPIVIPCNTIIEIWEVIGRLTTQLGNSISADPAANNVAASVLEIRFELDKLTKRAKN